METTKIIGYLIAVIGLVVIALSNQISKMLSFLGAKASLITIVGGLILVIVGIVLVVMVKGSSSYSNVKHAEQEVPIYEGKGKNRKIVGYHRAIE